MAFFEIYKSGFIIRIKLTPNANICEFRDVLTAPDGQEYLRTSVTVVPEKGKANQELVKLLAKHLKLPKTVLKIVSGETDHWKKIFADVPLTDEISQNLQNLIRKK